MKILRGAGGAGSLPGCGATSHVFFRKGLSMKIIVSGGGTGGHIYPALTIIRAIESIRNDAEFLYVGTERGLEADIIPKEGLPFATVDLQGFERHFTLANFKRAGIAMVAVTKALKLVKKFQPDLVIGTGGYVCGPVLLAAGILHIPTVIQEQNVVAGITNKLLSHFVSKVSLGMPEAGRHFPVNKTVYTGNPIRAEVMSATRDEGIAALGLDKNLPTVLISGGSRGARSINRAMVPVLAKAAADPTRQYVHVTGKDEYDDVVHRVRETGVDLAQATHIKIFPYLYNMPQALAAADLAVFRAGAIGLAELMARGVPSILIPYPYAAENHQEYNAMAARDAGAARMILNKDLTAEILGQTIDELLDNPAALAEMKQACAKLAKPNAAQEIAELAISLV